MTRYVLGLVFLMTVLVAGPASGQATPSSMASPSAVVSPIEAALPTAATPLIAAARPSATAPSVAEVSAETVPLGSTFELRVRVAVPAGSTVYFPDKLLTTEAVESHGSVRAKAEAAADGATLTLTYPLIAFGLGDVVIPGFDVLVGPIDRAAGEASLPGGSSIGAWDHARDAGHASSVLMRVPPRRVRVASVFQLEAVLAGVGPMPAADVIGASWNRPSLVLLFVSSCALIAVLVTTMRKRLRSRTRGTGSLVIAGSSLDDAKCAALTELDSLLALGLHTAGRTQEFYTTSSAIVRRYAKQLDARWGPGLTSTELMRALLAHGNAAPADELSAEMSAAEVVKFGQRRPEVSAAEAHWRAVREWIEKSEGGIRGH